MAVKTTNDIQETSSNTDGPSEAKRPKEDFTYWNNTNTVGSTESWFWRWYKHYGFHNPVEPLPLVKSKSTLDTVLLNLNNNHLQEDIKENNATISSDEDDPPESAEEALKHGEKFLRWLECCSDPSVTAVQLLQFRYLLNNVRSCAERKANKNKVPPARSRRK
ncbi:hypothetical protein O3M35_004659 [Rhynocoris fuscipes]|uniref:Uncharacterized protein n=1 Tax=Rhynocoris fuscipes TaxID=488301 RepID=A0AAW1CM50_9HEMI